jgi:hypothetical protein
MIKGMMKNIRISWATLFTKEYVWVDIVLGWFKYFVWTKKMPNNFGLPNVCSICSYGFCWVLLVWALWLQLSNFMKFACKIMGTFELQNWPLTIRDNYRIYILIIILNARVIVSLRCEIFKMSNVSHLTMSLPSCKIWKWADIFSKGFIWEF